MSVVVLALVGLIPVTYRREKGLAPLGWVLLIGGTFIFILSTVVKEIKTKEEEERLRQKTEQILEVVAGLVMEAPKEVSPVLTEGASGGLQIKKPLDGAKVFQRPYIEGAVSNPRAKVWVVVHPMEVSAYWVQPTITVRKDGTWKVMAYLGRSGVIDVGKQFEIMTVADAKEALMEGMVLSGWPAAQWRSQVIVVTRK